METNKKANWVRFDDLTKDELKCVVSDAMYYILMNADSIPHVREIAEPIIMMYKSIKD